jgi:hypothetical protein
VLAATESAEDREARHQAKAVRDADRAAEDAAHTPAPANLAGDAVRATWKQHGNPTKGWTFLGTAVKAPAAKGTKITKVEVDPQGITLSARGGPVEGGRFGTATKFWAIVPADAPRAEAPAKPASTGTTGRAKLELAFQGKPAPKGYTVRWSGAPIAPATDYLKAEAKDTDPQWLVRCNAHNTTAPAKSVEDCKKVGTKAQRITWCPQCATALAAS